MGGDGNVGCVLKNTYIFFTPALPLPRPKQSCTFTVDAAVDVAFFFMYSGMSTAIDYKVYKGAQAKKPKFQV